MAGEISRYLLLYGLPALIAGMVALYWPWRRRHRFSTRFLIDAPRERIWDIYHTDLDDPVSAALHSDTVSVTPDAQDPAMYEIVMDGSGGHGTGLMTVRLQTLLEDRPRKSASRVTAIDGKPFPNGRKSAEILQLAETGAGTRVTLSWHGETRNWGQFLGIRRHIRRYLKKLKTLAEADAVPAQGTLARFAWKPLALSVLALASFALLFGWSGALGLVLVIVLHEFGHWLAMRVTGQPKPRVVLIPFLGGVAVANHPHETLFDDAFCALMGPMLSIVPCMVFISLTATMLPAAIPLLGGGPPVDGAAAWTAQLLVISAKLTLLFGVLNALQLVPVLPLDGGQVLRAVIQSFSGRLAKWFLLVVTLAGLVGFTALGDYILAGVLGLGALQAWYMEAVPPKVRPMRAVSIVIIGLGYVLTLVVHLGAMSYGFYVLSFARDYLPV
jgi:Zn-dependent protease